MEPVNSIVPMGPTEAQRHQTPNPGPPHTDTKPRPGCCSTAARKSRPRSPTDVLRGAWPPRMAISPLLSSLVASCTFVHRKERSPGGTSILSLSLCQPFFLLRSVRGQRRIHGRQQYGALREVDDRSDPLFQDRHSFETASANDRFITPLSLPRMVRGFHRLYPHSRLTRRWHTLQPLDG